MLGQLFFGSTNTKAKVATIVKSAKEAYGCLIENRFEHELCQPEISSYKFATDVESMNLNHIPKLKTVQFFVISACTI